MDYKNLIVEERDRIGIITFNRPPLNILNIEMMKEINHALKSLKEKTLRALVIKANGKAFSAGVDVGEHTEDKVEEMIRVFHEIFTNLYSIDAPTIALVNGAALGGGCEIAAFCDLVIASDKSKFGQPEIKVGVFPPIATAIFPHLIKGKKALELILTGETISAEEAKEIGLVNQVVSSDKFEEAENFIKKLTCNSAVVLKIAKRAFLEGAMKGYQSIKKIEDLYLKDLMKTYDANEGLSAFLEKRKPRWRDE
jgi:cyclohexa-1,5-dienecarbonyl-CoA hydratase